MIVVVVVVVVVVNVDVDRWFLTKSLKCFRADKLFRSKARRHFERKSPNCYFVAKPDTNFNANTNAGSRNCDHYRVRSIMELAVNYHRRVL